MGNAEIDSVNLEYQAPLEDILCHLGDFDPILHNCYIPRWTPL